MKKAIINICIFIAAIALLITAACFTFKDCVSKKGFIDDYYEYMYTPEDDENLYIGPEKHAYANDIVLGIFELLACIGCTTGIVFNVSEVYTAIKHKSVTD